MSLESTDEQKLSQLFTVLSDPRRIRILAALHHAELCVCHIECLLDLPQSSVSRHLSSLKQAELVATRRSGKWIYYRLRTPSDPLLARQFTTLMSSLPVPEQKYLNAILEQVGPDLCC